MTETARPGMHYQVLAVDYDGTLATEGKAEGEVIQALERLVASGRKLFLVTGRELEDLKSTFGHLSLFERVVAENGALLYLPATDGFRLLANAPPPSFAEALRARGVAPLSVGHVIVATWEPHQSTVLDVIRASGLELEVIFNKGAVMVLPSGVNKGTGLRVALAELGISKERTVAVGDAENDHSFLNLCAIAVAVANAIPALKDQADLVTTRPRGAGVIEVIDRLLADDFAGIEARRGPGTPTG